MSTKKYRKCGDQNVPIAPAPWQLAVEDSWVCPFWFNKKKHGHLLLSDSDKADSCDYGVGIVMIVSYHDCPVGAYDELLIMVPFKNPSISGEVLPCYRIPIIFVSSEASLRNGRRNWGIRKELADFQWVKSTRLCLTSYRLIVSDRFEGGILFDGTFHTFSIPLFPVPVGMLGKMRPLIGEKKIDEDGIENACRREWVLTRIGGFGWCRLSIGWVNSIVGNLSIFFAAHLRGSLHFPVPVCLKQ
jgi:hypothetical protein